MTEDEKFSRLRGKLYGVSKFLPNEGERVQQSREEGGNRQA